MILGNAGIKIPGCPCCKCCCTVQRQVRGFNFATGTWDCTPAPTLTRTINGSAASWSSGSFSVCEGDVLAISGYPETLFCGGNLYTFAQASLAVYCNGAMVWATETTDYATALEYTHSTCWCVTDDCEILVDVVYTRGTPTDLGTAKWNDNGTWFLNSSDVCAFRACFPSDALSELHFRMNYPDTNGRTLIPFNSDADLPASLFGKTLTVELMQAVRCDGTPVQWSAHLAQVKWNATPGCVVNTSASRSWTLPSSFNLTISTRFVDDAAPCSGTSLSC